jgi:membrane-associated phospholipid phosphatase
MPFTRIDQHSTTATGTRAEEADIAVTQRLARHRHHGAVRALGTLSEAGDQAPLLSLSGAVLVFGLSTGETRTAKAGGRMLAAVLVATGIKSLLKHLVSRTRPHVLLDEGRYAVQALGPDEGPSQSFPSGHTAGSVAAARALVRVFPGARGPAYAGAGAIALMQVPRGKHYPVDVIAGAVVGVAAEAIVDRVATIAEPRSALTQVHPR